MAKRNRSGSSLLANNRIIFGGVAVLLIIVFVGALTLLKSTVQTETYYVLNDELGETIPARTLVTEEMLSPMVIAADTAPPTALSIDEIMENYVYTKYALNPGDILTSSNAGDVDDIYNGVPDNWVITNFSVDADSAVGGRIRAGTYFDMMIATDSGSFYPFINVLTLDATVDLSSASSAAAAESSEAYEGQTSQYVVAMSPQDAGRLHNLVRTYPDAIKLVLSPQQNNYNKPNISDYSEVFTFDDPTSPIWPGKSDEGEVTDSDFNRVERNEAGEPLEKVNPRNEGNLRSETRSDISSDTKYKDSQ